MTARRLPFLVLLVAALLAACGKGDDSPAMSGDPVEEPASTSTTATTAEEEGEDEAEVTTIELTGAEYVYAAGVPTEPVPAGEVTVSFENTGVEEHQASVVRFKEGKALPDLIAVGEDPSKLATVIDAYGGPNAVAPGATVESTQVLVPGEYLFICFIPTPDGQPHATQGMLAPFTVEGDEPDDAPAADGAVALDEYSFGEDGDDTLEAGEITFVNDGDQPHEAAVYALAGGASFDDAKAFLADPASAAGGAPPIMPAGGIGPLSPGISSTVALDVDPGDYVFVCFIPDVADGAPHLAKGMIELVSIE